MKITCVVCSTNRRISRLLLLAMAPVLLSGCAAIGAKPWEHDLLAEHAMQVDPYPLQSAMDDHIYFSKEASSGGRSFAGGGCGCN
jgi:Domain of unknown function (DUF4266)